MWTSDYAEGQEICHQGDPGDAMYVILGGIADVLIDSDKGGQITVAEMRKNNFVGDMAILCDVPRTATVVALADSLLLALEREPFLEAVTHHRRSREAADGVVDERMRDAPEARGI